MWVQHRVLRSYPNRAMRESSMQSQAETSLLTEKPSLNTLHSHTIQKLQIRSGSYAKWNFVLLPKIARKYSGTT